jgi:hypothetical protein
MASVPLSGCVKVSVSIAPLDRLE